MSDLQVSLLIIAAVVVGGVTAFNWFQQWRPRRKLEQGFGSKPDDVLLREEPPRDSGGRVEPQLQGSRAAGGSDAGIAYSPLPPDSPPPLAPPHNAARKDV